MKIIAMIPARYAATRFEGKLMAGLKGKPVIRHTYDATVATGLFHETVVVTDSDMIYKEITGSGGRAIMSRKEHESGSDLIAGAAAGLDVDVIVNVQGLCRLCFYDPCRRCCRPGKALHKEVHIAS